MVEAIIWRYRTGSPWRDLPEEFGPWQTVWKRLDRWSRDGTLERLLAAAHSDAEVAAELEWVTSVDSSVARAHQHAAGAGRRGDPDTAAAESAGGTGGRVELHASGPCRA